MSAATRDGRDVTASRPDASMSLLVDLMRDAADDEYVEAARRRSAEPSGPTGAAGPDGPTGRRPRRGRGLRAAVALLVVGLLLAAGVVDWRGQSAAVTAERSGLVDAVRVATARTDDLAARAAALEAEVARLRDAELGSGARRGDSGDVQQRLAELAGATGTTEVRGAGLRVEVSDAPDDSAVAPTSGCEDGRVLDVDLQRLANGLWAAGATAVSVDGVRLTALTAIRSADRAVLVGYRPVDPPYEVLALGDPPQLEQRLAAGDVASWFGALEQECGIGYAVTPAPDLVLPAAAAVDVRLAQPVAPGASS